MTELSRRTILGAAAVAGLAVAPGRAQPLPGDEVVELWPGAPPGAGATIVDATKNHSKDPAHPDRLIAGVARPVMIVRRAARPNGTAVLLMPGGGYGYLSYDNEGISQAAWLNARGVTAFILLYRLPAEGWQQRADVPLQDAQRAMRLIRARASSFGVRADRIAIIGFSAGGHLAGSLATRHAAKIYEPVDAADRLSARPDIAGLIYPVISLATLTHSGSRNNLLGADSSMEQRRAYSVDLAVDAQTPPVFLVHAADDGTVPVDNSLAMLAAMRAQQRPAELHVFAEGGHGFGVRLPPTMPASQWPVLFGAFARRQGVAVDPA